MPTGSITWRRVVVVLAGLVVVVLALATTTALVIAARDGRLPDLATSPQLVGHAALALAIVVALIGSVFFREGYLAGVWLVSTLFAWTAAVGAVVTYLVTGAGTRGIDIRISVVYDGLAVGLAFVACTAFVGRELARPARAQARIWDSLRDRHAQLKARYDEIDASLVDEHRRSQAKTMLHEADSRFLQVDGELKPDAGPAIRWALATGYSNLQRTLHRIDEMIVAAQPDYAVTGDALHDALSLSDSTIADSEVLSIRLRTAMQAISPNSAASFFPARGAPLTPPPDPQALPSPAEAREVLREVRFAVNDFRDERVDGIILARNRLLLVVVTVGITAYFALGLAILCGVDAATLCVVSALYLVAALAGLINRLRIESSRSTAVDDYGLHIARLIATPLLSGLAGIAGVYLVATSPALLNVVSPTTGGGPPAPIDVGHVFDLAANQTSLLVAAVFGLVPAQLFSGLQRQADQFQTDLERSAPSGGSTLTKASG